jgi:2-keto-4-pentenoate hydratase/2-oxohepta-3-ene-1,7-dioic acid hydratase in catechol pathway
VKLVNYLVDGRWQAGVLVGDTVHDAARLASGSEPGAAPSVDAYVCNPELADALRLALPDATDGSAVGEVDDLLLGAPLVAPSKVICVGLNYKEHADEVLKEVPAVPTLFAKFATSLTGPRAPLVMPSLDDPQLDYEGELAIVIGSRTRRVAADEALRHVFGAMVLNDVTSRRLQYASTQWTLGKALDALTPCGPALVSLDEIPDLQRLELTTVVNGEVVQAASTASMIWSVAELVSIVSQTITLEPGDVIATGTPAGIGARRSPPLFLQPGDVVSVSVEGLGTLRNEVVECQ